MCLNDKNCAAEYIHKKPTGKVNSKYEQFCYTRGQ